MALDLIVQEAEGMSDELLMEVLHFMKFIKIEQIVADSQKSFSAKRTKRRTGGIYHGQIRIAEDFDAPLDDFREYM